MAGNLVPPQPEPTGTLERPSSTALQDRAAPPPPNAKGAKPEDPAKEEKDGKSSGLQLVRPAETGWEAGRIKRNAGVFPVQRPSEGPKAEESAKNKGQNANIGIVVGVPARQVLGLPLWLATDDASLFGDMVQLQLEKRGVTQGPMPSYRLQNRVVVKETGRTLVLALVLAEPCAEEMLATGARAFEPSPFTYPISENSLVFWKEQGQVIMAYRRGPHLAYLHAFTHAEVSAALTTELTCVLLPLMQDQVLVDLKKVSAWGDFSAGEISLLGQSLEFPVQTGPRPGMALPSEQSPLIPEAVVIRRETKRRNQRMKRIGLLLAACYLVFLSFVVGQFLMLKLQVSQAEGKLSHDAPTVKRLASARDTWLAIEPSIDPQFYVSEVLLQSALSLPPTGVRWTNFQTEPGAITLRGEAKSFREAQVYYQDLSKRETLSNFNWQLSDQKVLADGRATFQITGKNASYAGNDQ